MEETKESTPIESDDNKLLNKKRRPYIYNDFIEKEWKVDNDIVIRVINNESGRFVDMRRYYGDKPTRKGLRLRDVLFIDYFNIVKTYIDKQNMK